MRLVAFFGVFLAIGCFLNAAGQSIPAAERIELIACGSSWINNSLWTTDASPCSWYGVSCLHDNPPHVFGLSLVNNGLNGTIPPSILALNQLYTLNVAGNYIYGTVPLFLGNLSAIQSIDIAYNRFVGELPQALFLWLAPHLTSFNATGNALNGSIPLSLQLVPHVALEHNDFDCQYDAWMYRFMSACPQDTEYIAALFRLIGWVLFASILMTVICVVLVTLAPKTTLLNDPAIPEYTPDQLTQVFFERSKKKKQKSLKTGGRRQQRFTLPNLERPVPALATSQQPASGETSPRAASKAFSPRMPATDPRQDVHYVGFAEFGLRP